MWLFLALVAVPIVEIGLFIQVGGWLGLWPTLGIVVLTAVAGTLILRVQGARAMMDLKQAMTSLSDPTGPLAHGAMILVAGVLLLTPGFFTDAVGFALLMPPVRTLLIARLRGRIRFTSAGAGTPPPQGARHPDARVIDGDYEEVPRETPRTGHDPDAPRGTSGWTKP